MHNRQPLAGRPLTERFEADLSADGRRLSERIRTLRERLGLTQADFAYKYNISVANIRNWEQDKRGTKPDASARLLIDMIDAEPDIVAALVERAKQKSAEFTY